MSCCKNKRNPNRNTVLIEIRPTMPYSEVLIDNKVEKYLQSVLRPLNLIQAFFLCSKYTIRDNFITSNSYLYNFIGLFSTLIFRSIGLYNMFSNQWYDSKLFIYWSSICDFVFYSMGYFLNNYTNITQGDNNVLLVLKIQQICRVLKINGKNLRNMVIYNWISVISLNSFLIFLILYINYTVCPHIKIIHIMATFVTMSFDMNIVYALLVMKLLTKTLGIWIEDVRSSANREDSERESYWKTMFNVYLNIQEAYNLIEETFRPLVSFFYTFSFFGNAFMNSYHIIFISVVFLYNAYVSVSFV